MTDNRARNGKLGAILGALIAVALAVFLLNGGEHVGKKRSTATPIFRRLRRGSRASVRLPRIAEPRLRLDVNFQEVVHSALTGNADVAKPQ